MLTDSRVSKRYPKPVYRPFVLDDLLEMWTIVPLSGKSTDFTLGFG